MNNDNSNEANGALACSKETGKTGKTARRHHGKVEDEQGDMETGSAQIPSLFPLPFSIPFCSDAMSFPRN